MFETTEPDEQQKEIAKLQKLIVQRKDGEIERLTRRANDCNNKCNELIRQVKLEQKNAAEFELRPYQLESVERLRQGIRDGHRSQLLCAPTGSGKTIIAAF
jgi:superfamily II DNA or RNA helicase